MPPRILSTLYRGAVESIHTGNITVWGGNCTEAELNSLQRSENSGKDHRQVLPLHPGHLQEMLQKQSRQHRERCLPPCVRTVRMDARREKETVPYPGNEETDH